MHSSHTNVNLSEIEAVHSARSALFTVRPVLKLRHAPHFMITVGPLLDHRVIILSHEADLDFIKPSYLPMSDVQVRGGACSDPMPC